MRSAIFFIVVLSTLLCASVSLSGATIPVFGTGLNASGQFLAAGAVDPHYVLTLNYLGTGSNAYIPGGATPSQAVANGVPPGWPLSAGTWAPDSLAQWIAPVVDVVNLPGLGTNTFYTYQTTFDLTGFNIATVQISGHLAGDNYVSQALLNGVPFYANSSCLTNGNIGFTAVAPFSISSGFQAGLNTLTFNVTNDTCYNAPPATNPTGLLVDIAGTGDLITAVPEPATMFPVGIGLAIAGWLYRRRRH